MTATNNTIRRLTIAGILLLSAAMPFLLGAGHPGRALAAGQGQAAKPGNDIKPARPQGGTWSALGSGVDNIVQAIVVSDTNVYVGGGFNNAGGLPAVHIAKWNGSAWSALGGGTNTSAVAIAISGNDVYVGGSFTTASGVTVNRIARWDGTQWNPLGTGLGNGTVWAIAISGNNVYVGGTFTTAGGVPASRIARWDGSQWYALGAGVSSDVYALAISGNNVYAGGFFNTAGGITVNRVARWDGSNWNAMGSGVSYQANAIAVSGNDVYVGGIFATAGGVTVNNIAKWNGSAWSALAGGVNNEVTSLAVSGNDLYVGGEFTAAGGQPINRVAGWNGSSWFDLAGGVNDANSALAIGSNGVYAGGYFSSAGGVPASRIALYQTNGLPTITPGPTQTPTRTAMPTATFTSVPGNNPPVLTVPLNQPYRVGVEVGNYLALRFDAADPDTDDQVRYSVSGLPSGASFPIPPAGNPINSTFTWRPGSADIGTYQVTITATDSHGAQDVATVQIDVVPGCVPYFTDVFTNEYFYPGVQYLFCKLVVSGYLEPDQTVTYRPYKNTTRGQFSKMIVLAYNIPAYDPGTPTFTDVPRTDTFFAYVEAAYNAGIISGYADRTFRGSSPITRGQLSKLVVGAAQWPIDTSGGPHFADVPPGSTFYEVIETAFNNGVITGYSCGGVDEPCDTQNRPYFRVGNYTTRGQIAKILWQSQGSPPPR